MFGTKKEALPDYCEDKDFNDAKPNFIARQPIVDKSKEPVSPPTQIDGQFKNM